MAGFFKKDINNLWGDLHKYKINHPIAFFFLILCFWMIIQSYGVLDGSLYIIDFFVFIILYRFIAGIR